MTRAGLAAQAAAVLLAAACGGTPIPSGVPPPVDSVASPSFTSSVPASRSSSTPARTTIDAEETIEVIASGAPTCPQPVTSYIPPGFTLSNRQTVDSGGGRLAINETYRSAEGAELGFGWGMGGEVGGQPTGEQVTVRGRSVPLLRTEDGFLVVWFEAPLEQPCHQYFVGGYLVPRQEFLKVLAGMR